MKISKIHVPGSRMLAGVAIGLLVGVLAVGVVSAANSSPSGALSPTSTAAGDAADAGSAGSALAGLDLAGGNLRQALIRNFRLDLTATSLGGTRSFLYVRGSLQLSPTSVTVTLPNSSTQTFTVDSSTVVRENGKTIAYADLADGARAMVFGTKNNDGSYTAKLIRCVKAPTA